MVTGLVSRIMHRTQLFQEFKVCGFLVTVSGPNYTGPSLKSILTIMFLVLSSSFLVFSSIFLVFSSTFLVFSSTFLVFSSIFLVFSNISCCSDVYKMLASACCGVRGACLVVRDGVS